MPLIDLKRIYFLKTMIAGVDEVGRGCIAGPVVAAKVILQANIEGIKDSKKLSEKRNEPSVSIKSNAIYSFWIEFK